MEKGYNRRVSASFSSEVPLSINRNQRQYGKVCASLLPILLFLPFITAFQDQTVGLQILSPPQDTPPIVSPSSGGGGGIGIPKYYCQKINVSFEIDEVCRKYNTTCQLPVPREFIDMFEECEYTEQVQVVTPPKVITIDLLPLNESRPAAASVVQEQKIEPPPPPAPISEVIDVPSPKLDFAKFIFPLMIIFCLIAAYFCYRILNRKEIPKEVS